MSKLPAITKEELLARLAVAPGGADLADLNLSGLQLSNINLRRAKLHRVDLTLTVLAHADLIRSKISQCNSSWG